MTAIAFVCVADRKVLCAASKTLDDWRDAVFEFYESLKDSEWQAITIAAFRELTEAEMPNDYKVKPEKGATPEPPNS